MTKPNAMQAVQDKIRDWLGRIAGWPEETALPAAYLAMLFVTLVLTAGLATFLAAPQAAPPPVLAATPATLPVVQPQQDAKSFSEPLPTLEVTRQPAEPVSVTFQGPVTVIDARTFGSEQATVTLRGIEAPGRDAVCLNGDGNRWACGLWARAALNNLTRSGEIKCLGARVDSILIESDCSTAAGDLATQLVLSGFARGIPPESHAQAEAAAREAQRGLWNGGWTVVAQ